MQNENDEYGPNYRTKRVCFWMLHEPEAIAGQLGGQYPWCELTPKQGLAWVKRHGVVLQAARGPVPSLAEVIAGGPIQGSWWGHEKGHEIFRVAEAISENRDVLVCKLVDGKVTFIHRRLWPALVKLASRFHKDRLAKVWNEHTPTGAHRSRQIPYPEWVPGEVMRLAQRLSIEEAEQILSSWPALVGMRAGAARESNAAERA